MSKRVGRPQAHWDFSLHVSPQGVWVIARPDDDRPELHWGPYSPDDATAQLERLKTTDLGEPNGRG
jgi:hypothetical protein